MPREGLLVLLVEDSPDTLDAFSHFLRTAGFRVETAVDGRQAVDKARSLRPDVVVMDLALPELDGWEATHQIKSDPATRDTPVIAFTGHAFQQAVSAELPKVEADRIGFTPTLLLRREGEAPERITGDLADADHVGQSLRKAGLPPKAR